MNLKKRIVPATLTCLGVLFSLVTLYLLQNVVSWILFYSFCLCCGMMGLFTGASIALNSKQYKPVLDRRKPRSFNILRQMAENRCTYTVPKRGLITSANLDAVIQEVLSFIVRDYISTFYDDIAKDPKIVERIEYDIWQVIGKLADRLDQIDMVKLITQDVAIRLTQHFQDIRFAGDRPKSGIRPKFLLLPWLVSEEKELQFLRRITEALMVDLLPDTYKLCTLSRQLIRETVACKILKPAVDLLCDPDYLNQQMFGYLDWKEKLSEESNRTYRFAASYEDFIEMIQQLEDIEHLKQVRYTIISEIMQATTIKNLKKADGLETDKDTPPKSSNKGDLLKARNLKRYINQLTVCKSLVEKRIRLQGGAEYMSYGDEGEDRLTDAALPGNKVLSSSVIMENPTAKDYFVSSKDDRAKDSIAEPLYGLVGEVFQLKGVFKWLRRSLIVFVQVTFGRTINRQLRETIGWLFSESMLIYYIHVFRDAWWPNGALAEDPPPRTDEQKLRTRMMAKAKVVTYISELTKNLIGENNAKFGAIKLFESLQETRLNRHLFYVILELCMYEVCPGLKKPDDMT